MTLWLRLLRPISFARDVALKTGMLLALLSSASVAHANVGSREWIEREGSSAAVVIRSSAPARVQRIRLALDFRRRAQGVSVAQYELITLGSSRWQGEAVFVARARAVRVDLDGVPLETLPVPGPLPVPEDVGSSITGELLGFQLVLEPGRVHRLRVQFVCVPQLHGERFEGRFADGLYRAARGTPARRFEVFDYPIWPAFTFGGGVGAMDVSILTDSDASPVRAYRRHMEQSVGWKIGIHHDGTLESQLVVPPATDLDSAEIHEIAVEYQPANPPLVGASLLAALRVSGGREPPVAPNVRLTADLVLPEAFGISAGGETDFLRSWTALVSLQRGQASAYASAYYGAGALVAFGPGMAAGFEIEAGGRLFFVPLDVAVQFFPYRPATAEHIARARVLIGVKLGL